MPAEMREQMRSQFLGTLILLIIQFLLGMALNLFVTIPTNHPGANPPEYFGGVVQSVTWAILHGHVLLIIHASLGLLLVLNALGLLLAAIRRIRLCAESPPVSAPSARRCRRRARSRSTRRMSSRSRTPR